MINNVKNPAIIIPKKPTMWGHFASAKKCHEDSQFLGIKNPPIIFYTKSSPFGDGRQVANLRSRGGPRHKINDLKRQLGTSVFFEI